jgi:hypothetical protein
MLTFWGSFAVVRLSAPPWAISATSVGHRCDLIVSRSHLVALRAVGPIMTLNSQFNLSNGGFGELYLNGLGSAVFAFRSARFDSAADALPLIDLQVHDGVDPRRAVLRRLVFVLCKPKMSSV